MKKDIVWLDYSRFIGIFLVVFCHSFPTIAQWNDSKLAEAIWDYIYLFHMPLFFIISGYLYKQGESNGLKRLWHHLVIPYILYQLLYLPVQLIHFKQEITDVDLWIKFFVGLLAGDGYDTPISYHICLPCWFIICIIQLHLFFLYIPIKKITSIIICVFSILFLVIRKYYALDFFFCVDCTIMALPYFLLGHYLGKNGFVESINGRKTNLFIAFISGIIVYFILKYNGAAQMNVLSYGDNVFLNYLAGIIGSLMIFMIAKVLADLWHEKERIKTISRNTLFIIFFHWLLLTFWGIILSKAIIMLDVSVSFVFIICASFLITLVILWISKKMIDYGGKRIPLLFGKSR
jgi:fucose 4-O-acetylase-like acetyltransferase